LSAIGQTYRPARELRAHSPDALIVTGAEPHAPDLRDEPYWRELAGLAAWAQSHTISCLFSCLAAHAEVLRRDKIVRRRQPIKLHGVFEAEVVASHELVEGLGARASIPHSRYNGLDEGELAAKGYVTLTRSREGGVDMFVLEEETSRSSCRVIPNMTPTRSHVNTVAMFSDLCRASYPRPPCRLEITFRRRSRRGLPLGSNDPPTACLPSFPPRHFSKARRLGVRQACGFFAIGSRPSRVVRLRSAHLRFRPVNARHRVAGNDPPEKAS
jgi:hypothetical protein